MQKVSVKFAAIKSDELRIKITYADLRHSDLHYVRGDWGPCSYPVAPGYEIFGTVTHFGSHVRDYKIGDRVGFGCQRGCCDKCEPCKIDFEQLCTAANLEQKWTCQGDKYWGGYATSLQQPAKFFFKIPESLPENKVPPLFCAGVTSYCLTL